MATGTGFGKTIFIGDQFVLRGVPAIVAALPFETECTVDRVDGQGWVLLDNRMEVPGYKEKKRDQQAESIDHVLEVMGIDVAQDPISITYGGSLLAGSGVGSSAASCVSLARALDKTFNLGLSIEEINEVGRQGEFAYHGIPSGVDNTASTYGGLLHYSVQNETRSFEKIVLKEPFRIVLANSGVTADTSTLNTYVLGIKERDPVGFQQIVDTITGMSWEMRAAFESNDLETVGTIMTVNHAILIEMGLSHEILDELCERAIEQGALGAKVTGGGRGGYMSALTPDEAVQEAVAASFEGDGYKVIRAVIGGQG